MADPPPRYEGQRGNHNEYQPPCTDVKRVEVIVSGKALLARYRGGACYQNATTEPEEQYLVGCDDNDDSPKGPACQRVTSTCPANAQNSAAAAYHKKRSGREADRCAHHTAAVCSNSLLGCNFTGSR